MLQIKSMTLQLDLQLEHCVQAPQLSKPEITFLGGEEIVRRVQPILKKRIGSTFYNRITLAEQFLDHYLHHPGNSALEALSTFHMHHDLTPQGGGSCIALTYDLIDHLSEEIHAYPVGATLPDHSTPLYSHVAAMIAFQNPEEEDDHGFILLDPSFAYAEPILLNSSSFSYNDVTYSLDHFDNPEEASALPFFAVDRIYPLISHNESGVQRAALTIDLNKRELHWETKEKHSLAFEAINSDPFDHKFTSMFNYESHELNDLVMKIINHAEIFDRLHFDYLNWLHHYELLHK